LAWFAVHLIRAVIIAARGVTISSNFLSGLLETDAIVLHCDERYQPCGWTAPLSRTVDLKTFQNQTAKPKRLNEKLWHEMLRGKTPPVWFILLPLQMTNCEFQGISHP